MLTFPNNTIYSYPIIDSYIRNTLKNNLYRIMQGLCRRRDQTDNLPNKKRGRTRLPVTSRPSDTEGAFSTLQSLAHGAKTSLSRNCSPDSCRFPLDRQCVKQKTQQEHIRCNRLKSAELDGCATYLKRFTSLAPPPKWTAANDALSTWNLQRSPTTRLYGWTGIFQKKNV